ncbi:OmpA family protein [Allomuricauda sp. SCSIO 65647]|uniref:OmpA family protein n=1 Tax=Allomuricauda sp. SCSIO 65647 TaxID=2908843 RepID=UPI001F23330C|nr:OmpA family protein [Muricauda sp. SCSIO 65647]UJH66618.1 OmpA family protein [Muricauda sp. SCSIO 65647]
MGTLKTIGFALLTIFCMGIVQVQGQNTLFKKVKNKVEDKVEEVVSEEAGDEGAVKTSNKKQMKEYVVDQGFINRADLLFHDDFNGERATEFPSKWTHIKGSIQNNSFSEAGQRDEVIEWISNYATIKPTIEGDDYLGDSFKIEIQVHFNLEGGNQFYNLNLRNSKDIYKHHDIRIANSLIGNGNDNLSRMPGQPPRGWHTIQVSFNKGNLKAFFDGVQLVNNPDIGKYEFTHIEIYASSPGSSRVGQTKSMINHFSIAKAGLPLYERLVTKGRIVVQDIYFDNDQYVIKKESYPALEKIVNMLKEHVDTEVTIEGHTDSNGTEEANQLLSENRAMAVKKYLVSKGIKSSRMSTVGYGEERPIDRSNNEKAWATNRRVEFVMR